jgi:hypothetical protein
MAGWSEIERAAAELAEKARAMLEAHVHETIAAQTTARRVRSGTGPRSSAGPPRTVRTSWRYPGNSANGARGPMVAIGRSPLSRGSIADR